MKKKLLSLTMALAMTITSFTNNSFSVVKAEEQSEDVVVTETVDPNAEGASENVEITPADPVTPADEPTEPAQNEEQGEVVEEQEGVDFDG